MGFFDAIQRSTTASTTAHFDLAYRKECLVCPLNRAPGLRHPKMEPSGSDHPEILMVGEAPGEVEDRKGIPFVGKSGRVIRDRIPAGWEGKLRWTNVIRTRPPKNRNPAPIEIAACRPKLERDIMATRPRAVFGFGNVPLNWFLGESGIKAWRGRMVPCRVGDHSFWYFPMLHPAGLLWSKDTPRGREEEFIFGKDLEAAFAIVPVLPPAKVHTRDEAMDDLTLIDGSNGGSDLRRIERFLLDDLDDPKKIVGFDYETHGLRPYAEQSQVLTVAVASKERTMAFGLDHREARWSPGEWQELHGILRKFLYQSRCRKVVHQLAFELEWSAYFFGRKSVRAQPWGDSIGQAFILDERPGTHSLDFLVREQFGLGIKALSNLNVKRLADEPLLPVLRYNAVDARYHRLLYLALRERLIDEGLVSVYAAHLRRVPTVVLTQLKGVPVDQRVVKKFYLDYVGKLAEIEEDIAGLKIVQRFRKQYKHEFRPSSNNDISIIVHGYLGHQSESVDEKVLSTIDHWLPKLVLEWREINKLLGTYVKPYIGPALAKELSEPGYPVKPSPDLHPDGMVHPILTTTRTRTWRTSSEDPNIQNQPKREHREVRGQVKGGGDLRVVSFDSAQIQARNVAMESKDKVLVRAFWERYDIHSDWMERVARAYPAWLKGGRKELEDKKRRKYYRDLVKNQLVFPKFFGAQSRSVAGYLGIPEAVAEVLGNDFEDLFGGIHKWHDRIKKFYQETGYVTGLTGFRRRGPISPNELINAPIQADESAIILSAMCALSELEEWRFQPNMEIHDDLTFLWPKKDIERNAEVVIREMLTIRFDWINVPLGVEMSVGEDWAHQEPAGEFFSDQLGYGPKPPVWLKGSGKEIRP